MVKHWIAPILGVACAYYITAALGLSWAVPPGYATMVWASSGVALGAVYAFGARVAPGVWLGSYLANLFVPTAYGRPVLFLAAIAPGLGAMLQACVGAAMLRRFCPGGIWSASAFVRLALVVAVSTGINGLLGPTSLWLAGAIPTELLQSCIRTWWIGDALGALVFAPLVIFMVDNARK